jgi:hypothetical protein
MYKSSIALILVLLVGLASPAAAGERPNLSNWDGVKQLRAGQQVRVWLAERVVTGTLLAAGDDDVVVRQAGREVTVKRAEVKRLAVLKNHDRKVALGALLGAAVGIGGGIGIMVASSPKGPQYASRGAGAAGAILLVSAPIAGAVLGGRWGTQTVYQAPRR